MSGCRSEAGGRLFQILGPATEKLKWHCCRKSILHVFVQYWWNEM